MNPAVEPPQFAVVEAVRRALAEDLTPLGDVTSALLPADTSTTARFVARADGVLAGRACADETLLQVDPTLEASWAVTDGDHIVAGQVLAEVRGPLRALLAAERTALNFLGHLSGIATETRRYAAAVAAVDGPARIWDTRKTTPGLRMLEKAAVRAGGGANHRGNLSDWVLVKDNHLEHLGITEAVESARDRWPGRFVHIECDTEAQAREATEAGADALLLDNMSVATVSACLEIIEEVVTATGGRRPLVEVSGGISLEEVGRYAVTGIDFISVGRLTNSAPVLDIALDIHPGPESPSGRAARSDEPRS
jgi:nicotinate-nucleotide pyrophosphorylase (carboxylating)